MKEKIEADARRNDLEAYIFNMRSNAVEGAKYGPFISPSNREEFMRQLQSAEDWLYDHMDDLKDVFVAKLAELKIIGAPVEQRYKDDLRRPELVSELEGAVRNYKASAQKLIPKASGLKETG